MQLSFQQQKTEKEKKSIVIKKIFGCEIDFLPLPRVVTFCIERNATGL
jgi:hypothetical protein